MSAGSCRGFWEPTIRVHSLNGEKEREILVAFVRMVHT